VEEGRTQKKKEPLREALQQEIKARAYFQKQRPDGVFQYQQRGKANGNLCSSWLKGMSTGRFPVGKGPLMRGSVRGLMTVGRSKICRKAPELRMDDGSLKRTKKKTKSAEGVPHTVPLPQREGTTSGDVHQS